MKNFFLGWFLVLSGFATFVGTVAAVVFLVKTFVPVAAIGPIVFVTIISLALAPLFIPLGERFTEWRNR